ncbi:hypothetical protein RNZ50_06240 [Paracoccaceae bacterium Fryx2]|nr:hypothetical protein [Paracoccaceae bacterium Fryx2]
MTPLFPGHSVHPHHIPDADLAALLRQAFAGLLPRGGLALLLDRLEGRA